MHLFKIQFKMNEIWLWAAALAVSKGRRNCLIAQDLYQIFKSQIQYGSGLVVIMRLFVVYIHRCQDSGCPNKVTLLSNGLGRACIVLGNYYFGHLLQGQSWIKHSKVLFMGILIRIFGPHHHFKSHRLGHPALIALWKSAIIKYHPRSHIYAFWPQHANT